MAGRPFLAIPKPKFLSAKSFMYADKAHKVKKIVKRILRAKNSHVDY